MTLLECFRNGKNRLSDADIDTADFDAEALFSAIFGLNRQALYLHGDADADEEAVRQYQAQIDLRASGRPLQYLLGEWPFRSCTFQVGDGVLIPREETEMLVAFELEKMPESGGKVLDLCSGSGAIAIACAAEFTEKSIPNQVTAVELSDAALHYLNLNVQKNNVSVQVLQHNILQPPPAAIAKQNIILSNPPYIPTADISGLQREVQQEPKMALDGGADGLLFYRAILRNWVPLLLPGGWIAVECGIGQAELLQTMFEEVGLTSCGIRKDFCAIDRVVFGQMPPKSSAN